MLPEGLRLTHTCTPGQQAYLTPGNLQAAMGRPSHPSDLSSHSLDDLGTDGLDPSDGAGTPATSNETNDTSMAIFGPSLGMDLMGMPLQDSGDLEPCHSFESDATPLDIEGRSQASSPLSVRDGPTAFLCAPPPPPAHLPSAQHLHHQMLSASTSPHRCLHSLPRNAARGQLPRQHHAWECGGESRA